MLWWKCVLTWMSCVLAIKAYAAKKSCPELLVRREILNSGFHRDLVTRLDIPGFAEQVNSCRILFQENIPSGLFLDPYQLSSLWQHNLTEVLLLTSVDVEAPEYLSTEHTALVYAKPDPVCRHCFFSTVPVHIRYHRPSAASHSVSLILQKPEVLIHCSKEFPPRTCLDYPVVEAPCGLETGRTCRWLNIPSTVSNEVLIQVPVGITQDGTVVCSLTLIMTLICTGMLIAAVYKNGPSYS
ncbi:phosphatidylinositol-glycan biosynthesis class X protein [Rhinophrynus dorsalis]